MISFPRPIHILWHLLTVPLANLHDSCSINRNILNFSSVFEKIGCTVHEIFVCYKEEKSKETKIKFWLLLYWKFQERFSANLVCRLPYLAGILVENLVPIG